MIEGLDLSHWNDKIKWDLLQKYMFIISKASQGTQYIDDQYLLQMAEATVRGKLTGAYHFYDYSPYHISSDQSDHFLRCIDKWPGDLPPSLDCERLWTTRMIGKGKRAKKVTIEVPKPSNKVYKAQIKSWAKHVSKVYGKKPLLYTSPDFLKYLAPDEELIELFDLWLAQWTYGGATPSPTAWPMWTIWQYNGDIPLPGQEGVFDVNYFDGTLSEMRQWAGLTVVPEPPIIIPPSTSLESRVSTLEHRVAELEIKIH
jgi:lysozyme